MVLLLSFDGELAAAQVGEIPLTQQPNLDRGKQVIVNSVRRK